MSCLTSAHDALSFDELLPHVQIPVKPAFFRAPRSEQCGVHLLLRGAMLTAGCSKYCGVRSSTVKENGDVAGLRRKAY